MGEGLRVLRGAAVLVATAVAVSGCALFGDDDTAATPVYDIEPGQCFLGPKEVKAQVEDLEEVSCDEPHDREAYAVVTYEAPSDQGDERAADEFPGGEELTRFAQGACAAEFQKYVGIDYADSDYYFTYLLPSPRSWEDEDRDILCLVIGAGEPLTTSVKDSRQ